MPNSATPKTSDAAPRAVGIEATFNRGGSLCGLAGAGVVLNLFPGTELEGGRIDVVLRLHADDGGVTASSLLGPASPGRVVKRGRRRWVEGLWQGLRFRVELRLAAKASAWFWHVEVANERSDAARIDLLHVQDVALAPLGAIRMNEAYVSQYIDHQPLAHATQGTVVASRQNAAVDDGRCPWMMLGSLGRAVGFATDALQTQGLAGRAGRPPAVWRDGLPGHRLQHEHSEVTLQDEVVTLAPGEATQRGFFGWLEADHPGATSNADLVFADCALALLARRVRPSAGQVDAVPSPANRFSHARLLDVDAPSTQDLERWFGLSSPRPMRHAEHAIDGSGDLLSFFTDDDRHVVLKAKELAVLRPHGHLMRSGAHWTPDESSVTTTAWMAGVFNSGLAQGHVSINTVLSHQRGYLNFFRAHGQRVFVDFGGGPRLLDVPSAFEIGPNRCRWFYRHRDGLVVVTSEASLDQPEVALSIEVLEGPLARLLIVHHLALNGQDGLAPMPVRWLEKGGELLLRPAAGTETKRRFPAGRVRVRPLGPASWSEAGDDRLLFDDGRTRRQPYLCLAYEPTRAAGVVLRCELIAARAPHPNADEFAMQTTGALTLRSHAATPNHEALQGLQSLAPWLAHNALVHYLSPRGLEQFSGGGWGTRDVSQGPLELLLALGRHDAVRDLLLRLFAAQNADGDWPQWFMFYPRDAGIRASDSHGDIVFWPLVALAQYLTASDDASILDESLPFWGAEAAPLSVHVDRAFDVIRGRMIRGTNLVAYGHGDWNDALQPADPAMREHLCSAWTVTLHYRMLTLLAEAWRAIGREADAAPLDAWRAGVLADFQRLLVVDGELAGYASFEDPQAVGYLLHPRDDKTGIRHSSLAMIHALIDELFTPEQATAHLALMREHLDGPDGMRLFDRPLAYTGGLQRLFQRGESASYFGREIGLMYMHAHLRFAEALAHLGRADEFFEALRRVNPIGIRSLVRSAALRQSNCYYSSSDARFDDRLEASAHYGRIATGEVVLEGGWRIYSSGAGIAFRLIVQCLLGLHQEASRLVVDPVLPPSLDGMGASLLLYGGTVAVTYHVGPRGHGPERVEVNGVSVPLTPLRNRYRMPGAAIEIAVLRARLRGDGTDRISVRIG